MKQKVEKQIQRWFWLSLLLISVITLAGCGQQAQTASQPSLEELENIWWGDNPELGTGPVTYEVLPLDPNLRGSSPRSSLFFFGFSFGTPCWKSPYSY